MSLVLLFGSLLLLHLLCFLISLFSNSHKGWVVAHVGLAIFNGIFFGIHLMK